MNKQRDTSEVEDTWALIHEYEDKLRLSDDPKEQGRCKREISRLRAIVTRLEGQAGRRPTTSIPVPPQPHFAHPYPLQRNFTGRVKERKMLTEWLTGETQPPLLALVAFGGMGKSALAWAWLQRDVLGLPLPGAAQDKPKDTKACRVPDDARPEGVFWWSFYERDSTFDGFVDAAYAYASGGTGGTEAAASTREKMEALVRRLRERPFLFVLDGFERLLRQYARMDAVYQKDDVADLPAHDRACADMNAATFLRRLSGGPFASLILFTSRLFPSELEGADGRPLANCREVALKDLRLPDAVAFLRAEAITGTRAELEAACRPTGCQPLGLSTLAGIILEDLETPGDVRAAERHDLLGEREGDKLTRILKAAYDALEPPDDMLVSSIAAFRSTAHLDAVSVFKNDASEAEFQSALKRLVDRRLVLRDREQNRYDLHPLVRAYAYQRLSAKQKVSVHGRLVEHFEPLAAEVPKENAALEQLAPVIELYHHMVGMETLDSGFDLLDSRLIEPLYYKLAAFQTLIELLLVLFKENKDEQHPMLQDENFQASVTNTLANCYSLSGQSRRAIPLFRASSAISREQGSRLNEAICNINLADDLVKLGELAGSMASLEIGIALAGEFPEPTGVFWNASGRVELGRLLAYEGRVDEAHDAISAASDVYANIGQTQGARVGFAYRALHYLQAGDAENALRAAYGSRDLTNVFPMDVDFIRAEWLIGAALIASDEEDKLSDAREHIDEALTRCRRINLVHFEPDILLSLARWHDASGDPAEAREHAVEALAIADRCEYRLQQADVHNFLARLDIDAGEEHKQTAIEHATKGYEYASCDGPPHCYKPALDEAERLCAELGVEPPELEPTPED